MIIIIRALSQWGKNGGDHDSPTSRDETPNEKKKEEKKSPKKERKREKGQCYFPFATLVLQSSTMIFIIRALSQWGKDEGDYDSPTSRDETPNEKNYNNNKRVLKRREPKKKKKKKKKRGNVTILYPHLCFKVAPCSSCSESHKLSFYTSGNFSL